MVRMEHAFRAAQIPVRQIWALTVKELRQLSRDRTLMIFIIYFFTLVIVQAGTTVSTELSNARILVHDADHSAASRDLIYRFQQPYFRYSGEVASADQGYRALERGDATMLLDIPEHFAKTLGRGEQTAKVQLLVDTSKATRGYLAYSYSVRIGAEFSQEWAQRHGARHGAKGALPVIESRPHTWYNPDLNEAWFATISELLTMMTVVCVLLPASALVREKERGTIEQLLVSPLSPFQIMFAKVLAMTLVILLGSAVSLLGIMRPMFGVPVRGSLALFFALTALYAFTSSGLGLLVATFARNSAQSGSLMLLVVMPIVLLSGTWTPLESLPPAIRTVMNLSPLRHYIDIAYGILLRGSGLATLWDSVLAMIVLGVALFGLGMWRFRRQFK